MATGSDTWTRECEAVACRAAKGYFIMGADHADLVQEARIGVLKAMRTWDATRGPIGAFMFTCAHAEVVTALVASQRGKRRVMNDALRFAAPLGEGTLADVVAGGVDPARIVIARDDAVRLLRQVAALSPIERDSIVRVRIHGESYWSDGGKAAKRTDNALQRATRKLKMAA